MNLTPAPTSFTVSVYGVTVAFGTSTAVQPVVSPVRVVASSGFVFGPLGVVGTAGVDQKIFAFPVVPKTAVGFGNLGLATFSGIDPVATSQPVSIIDWVVGQFATYMGPTIGTPTEFPVTIGESNDVAYGDRTLPYKGVPAIWTAAASLISATTGVTASGAYAAITGDARSGAKSGQAHGYAGDSSALAAGARGASGAALVVAYAATASATGARGRSGNVTASATATSVVVGVRNTRITGQSVVTASSVRSAPRGSLRHNLYGLLAASAALSKAAVVGIRKVTGYSAAYATALGAASGQVMARGTIGVVAASSGIATAHITASLGHVGASQARSSSTTGQVVASRASSGTSHVTSLWATAALSAKCNGIRFGVTQGAAASAACQSQGTLFQPAFSTGVCTGYTSTAIGAGSLTLTLLIEGAGVTAPPYAVGDFIVPEDITFDGTLNIAANFTLSAVVGLTVEADGYGNLPAVIGTGYAERAVDIDAVGTLLGPTPVGGGSSTYGDSVVATGIALASAAYAVGAGYTEWPIDLIGVITVPTVTMEGYAFFGEDITISGAGMLPPSLGSGYGFAGTAISASGVGVVPLMTGRGAASFPLPIRLSSGTPVIASVRASGAVQVIGYTGIFPLSEAIVEVTGSLTRNLRKASDTSEVHASGLPLNGLRRLFYTKPATALAEVAWEEQTEKKVKADGLPSGKLRAHAVVRTAATGVPANRANWYRGLGFHGAVATQGVATGRLRAKARIAGRTVGSAALRASLPRVSASALTREWLNKVATRRLTTPWACQGFLSKSSQVAIHSGTGTLYMVPVNTPFVMSAEYVPKSGDLIGADGAAPNRIGMLRRLNGHLVMDFRDPEQGEVILDLSTGSLLRWGGEGWVAHTTWPERALTAQRISQLDTTGTLGTYATLLGAVMEQAAYDCRHLSVRLDPIAAEADLLPHLAYTVGADYYDPAVSNTRTPEPLLRADIKQSTLVNRSKGLEASIARMLAAENLSGYLMVCWENPTTGVTAYAMPQEPGPPGFFPTSRVGLHIKNRNGTQVDGYAGLLERVAYRASTVLPACAKIGYFAAVATGITQDTVAMSDNLRITEIT